MSNISDSNNRKLIRPSLDAVKEKVQHQKRRPQPQRSTQQKGKRATPPEHTSAENFYYLKQMQNETSMVLVLQDGEELRGVIEWYDKACLKLNRPEGRNLLVYKDAIKYLYKDDEAMDAEANDKETARPAGSGGSDRVSSDGE